MSRSVALGVKIIRVFDRQFREKRLIIGVGGMSIQYKESGREKTLILCPPMTH
jgi:hypothetical protein